MPHAERYPWRLACRLLAGRRMWIVMLAICTLLDSGCVRRRLNVRSNPPGALVYVDNQQIGTTPCAVDFTYYGTREIRLVKPGYETLTVNQPIPAPWYQIPPLDFASENLVPTQIRDNRTVSYNLVPQVIVPTQQLLDRAEQLRQDTLQAPVAPAVFGQPVGPPPGYPTTPLPVLPPPGETSPVPILPPPTLTPPSTMPFSPPSQPALPQEGRPLVSPALR